MSIAAIDPRVCALLFLSVLVVLGVAPVVEVPLTGLEDGVESLDIAGLPVGWGDALLPDPLPFPLPLPPPTTGLLDGDGLLILVDGRVLEILVDGRVVLILVDVELGAVLLLGGMTGALFFWTKVVLTKLFPSGSQVTGTPTNACMALSQPNEFHP